MFDFPRKQQNILFLSFVCLSVCLFVRDGTHASCSCVAQKITGDIRADSILLLNEFQGFNVGIQVHQQLSLTTEITHMEFLLNILHIITHVICFLYSIIILNISDSQLHAV